MGASEILQTLARGDKLTVSDMAELTELSQSSIKKAVRRLLKDVSENIQKRSLTPVEKEERYGKKVGCKIYLYWLEK